MPLITEQQRQEIINRTGQIPGQNLQFNVQLQSGEILPADIQAGAGANPATIVLGGGVTPSGVSAPSPEQLLATVQSAAQQLAQSQPINVKTAGGTLSSASPEALAAERTRLTQPIKLPGVSPAGGSTPNLQLQPAGQTYTLPSGASYTVPQVSPTTSLVGDVQINSFQKEIKDLRTKISAGIAVGGKTQILEDLFTKFGVSEQRGISQELSKEILKQQQELRDLPENIKTRLENIGVSSAQLAAITTKESQKSREILARLLEQRGVAQESVNQALSFVRLFADSAFEDAAAQLQANKFELEGLEGDYKDLRSDQRFLLGKAFDARENRMKLALEVGKAGGTPAEQNAVLNAGSDAEANIAASPILARAGAQKLASDVAGGIAPQLVGLSLQQQAQIIKDAAARYNIDPNILVDSIRAAQAKETPSVIGSAEQGYLQFDPITNTWNAIAGMGGVGGAGRTTNLTDVMQAAIDKGLSAEVAAREAVIAAETLGIPVSVKLLDQWTEQAKKLVKTLPPTVPPTTPVKTTVGTGLTGPGAIPSPGIPIKSPLAEAGVTLPSISSLQKAYTDSFYANLFSQ